MAKKLAEIVAATVLCGELHPDKGNKGDQVR
jgi:hypothetical protein